MNNTGNAHNFWTDMVCKECGKCVRACPADIDIPSFLVMEERIHAGEDERAVIADYQKTRETGQVSNGQPLDCIECGICSVRCPQAFDLLGIVRKYAMKQASDYDVDDPCAEGVI
ncbi:MAG: 4Fe-4S dicluster domain-containing protein [Bilifractor sp.]|jgi:predicted aldo/keto reductase-like oxidoreductase